MQLCGGTRKTLDKYHPFFQVAEFDWELGCGFHGFSRHTQSVWKQREPHGFSWIGSFISQRMHVAFSVFSILCNCWLVLCTSSMHTSLEFLRLKSQEQVYRWGGCRHSLPFWVSELAQGCASSQQLSVFTVNLSISEYACETCMEGKPKVAQLAGAACEMCRCSTLRISLKFTFTNPELMSKCCHLSPSRKSIV